MINVPMITLNDGNSIPAIGMGVVFLDEGGKYSKYG